MMEFVLNWHPRQAPDTIWAMVGDSLRHLRLIKLVVHTDLPPLGEECDDELDDMAEIIKTKLTDTTHPDDGIISVSVGTRSGGEAAGAEFIVRLK